MRRILSACSLLVILGCSTTSGFGRIGEKYPGIQFNQKNASLCEAAASETTPTLMVFRIGDGKSPIKQHGLAIGTGSTELYSADFEWLMTPTEQEIVLLKGSKCMFLVKKNNEKTFSLYKLANAKSATKVKETPYEKIWYSTETYGGDLIKVQTREFLFDRLTVAGTPNAKSGAWDIAVPSESGEMFKIDDVLVTPQGKMFYPAIQSMQDGFKKSSSDHLVKVIHSDGTESLVSSIWDGNTYNAIPFGISKAGDYPAYFTVKDASTLNFKVEKRANGSPQYTFYSYLASGTHRYGSLSQAPTFVVPQGATIIGMRLLMDSPEASAGVLDYDNTDETMYYFDVFDNGGRPKFTLQLEHANGKKLWHLLFSNASAKEGIDTKGWLDLRQLNSPFPQGTIVGLGEDAQWAVTGYSKNLAFTNGVNEITAQKDADLFALAGKVNPILAQRDKAFAAKQDSEKKKAIADREAYIKSLPVECRKHLQSPQLMSGCLNGVKQLQNQMKLAQEKREQQEIIDQNNKRPINWRKGAMSGDNYYHLDEQKRTRQINNKLRCELRLSGCIH